MGLLVIKIFLILAILFIVAVFRIIKAGYKVLANDLPVWAEAVENFFDEEINKTLYSKSNLTSSPESYQKIRNEISDLYKFINEYSNTLFDTMVLMNFTLSLHMAKADGRIDSSETEGIREYLNQEFGDEVDHKILGQASTIIKKHLANFNNDELVLSANICLNIWNDVLEEAYSDLGKKEVEEIFLQLITSIFSFIYEVALMDGKIHENEVIFFNKLCKSFGYNEQSINYFIGIANYNFNARINSKNQQNREDNKFKNALELFQLKDNFSKEELQKAWKEFVKLNHPDKFHNFDKEIYEKMNSKFKEGKDLYDYLFSRLNSEQSSPKSNEQKNYDKNSEDYSYQEQTSKENYSSYKSSAYTNNYSSENSNYTVPNEPEDMIMRVPMKIFEFSKDYLNYFLIF